MKLTKKEQGYTRRLLEGRIGIIDHAIRYYTNLESDSRVMREEFLKLFGKKFYRNKTRIKKLEVELNLVNSILEKIK